VASQTTSLGFTIYAKDNASKAFKGIARDVDILEKRLTKVAKTTQAGVGIAALAGGATALTAAVVPAVAAMAAMPAVLMATKVATATLKVGLIGMGEAMSAIADGDSEALYKSLEKLSPSARAFAMETAGLKKRFDSLQGAVQEKLFSGLAGQLKPLADNLMPSVRKGMLGVAASLNYGAKQAAEFGRTAFAKGSLTKIFASSARITKTFGSAVKPLLSLVTQLAVKSLPLAEGLAKWATGGIKSAAAFTTSAEGAKKLERMLSGASKTMSQLGSIGGNVIKGLISIFSQAKSSANGLLDSLEEGSKTFAVWARSAEGQQKAAEAFALLRSAAEAVVDVLPLILGPLSLLSSLVTSLPEPLRDGVLQFVAFAAVLSMISSRVRPVVSTVQGFVTTVKSTEGPVGRFRDQMSGLSGPASKARGALSGLTGVLGGPWGAALTVGVGVMALFATRNNEAKRRVEDLTKALVDNKGALDDVSVANLKQRLESEGVYKAAQKLGVSLTVVTDAALGSAPAMEQLNRKLSENASVTQAVGGRGASTATQWKTLTGTAKMVQDAVSGSNGELKEARESYNRIIQANPSMVAAGGLTADSLFGVGTAAGKASTKVNALNTSLAKFKSLNGDADLAAISFRESLDGLSTAFKSNNVQIDARTGKISINNKAGREATRNLIESTQAAIDHSEKVRLQTGSVDKANKVFATEITRLKGVLSATGLSRAEIDKLVSRYLKMPEQLNKATGKILDRKVRIEVKAGGELIGYKVSGGTLLKADGGILPGYTPGRDPHMFYSQTGGALGLSGGEAVMRPEWTRAVGPAAIEQMNQAARTGGISGVRRALSGGVGSHRLGGEGAYYAGGGVIMKGSVSGLSSVQKMTERANELYGMWAANMGTSLSGFFNKMYSGGPGVQGALNWAKAQAGKPYIWGGVGPRGYDCSGFMSAITNKIKGRSPYSRLFSTHAFGASSGPGGFERNRKSGFQVGVTDAGVGHMAGTLGGVAVESRGSRGVVVGSGARGYNDGLFSRRYGMRMADGGVLRPRLYDEGGMLPTGTSLVHNGTGQPEYVLRPDQLGTGGDIAIHIHEARTPMATTREVVKELKRLKRNTGRNPLGLD
jgi:hypothetical protein